MEENTNPEENQPSGNSNAKPSLLPRLEILIIIVFFASFFIWAINKCSSTRAEYQAVEEQARIDDSIFDSQITFEQAPTNTTEDQTSTQPPQEPTSVVTERYTPLYVTLPNLNLRDRPNLSGRILGRLKLFDEVQFMEEVTTFKQEINLGDTTTFAPWIKVKSQAGTEGWVYGAGVHYYKTALNPEDVIE